MTGKPLALRALADRDIERIATHYLAESGEIVASQFLAELADGLSRVSAYPEIGTPRHGMAARMPDVRAWPLPKFPYLIFYHDLPDRILVFRVLHARQTIPARLRDR
jgi:toxin ParE1/3/4